MKSKCRNNNYRENLILISLPTLCAYISLYPSKQGYWWEDERERERQTDRQAEIGKEQ